MRPWLFPMVTVASALSAAEGEPSPSAQATPILMGYERMLNGQPVGTRVALTAQQIAALHALGDSATSADTIGTHSGHATLTLRLDPQSAQPSVNGAWRRAVVHDSVQSVSIPAPIARAGFSNLRALPLAGVQIGQATRNADHGVSVSARFQGVVACDFAQSVNAIADGFELQLPMRHNVATVIVAEPVEGWKAQIIGSHQGAPILSANGMAEIPAETEAITVRWTRVAQPPLAGTTSVSGRIALRLADDRSAWNWLGSYELMTPGAGLQVCDLRVPTGMAVTSVSGPAVSGWDVIDDIQDGVVKGRRLRVLFKQRQVEQALSIQALVALDAAGAALWMDGADRHAVRMAVPAMSGARAVISGGERSDVAAGEAMAILLRDPAAAKVALEAAVVNATWHEVLAVQDHPDGWLAWWCVAGLGAEETVTMAIPDGWSVRQSGRGAVALADGRIVVKAGSGVVLSMPRGASVALPALVSAAPGRMAARRVLVLPYGQHVLMPNGALVAEDAARLRASLLAAGLNLPRAAEAGERACRIEGPATVTAQALLDQPTSSAVHFAIVDRDRVRWSAHLRWQPGISPLRQLELSLPAGALLRRSDVPAGAVVRSQGDRLIATLAAPTMEAQSITLDLELPLSGNGATLHAPQAQNAAWSGATLAVAESDVGTSLIERRLHGLEAADGQVVLPEGVTKDAIQHQLRATRPDWSLALQREALQRGGGERDQIVTQADADSVWLADGELRHRLRLQVLNRSQGSLALDLTDTSVLIDVRVNGQSVRPRRDETRRHRVWIPVPRLRLGEAAARLEIDATDRVRPGAHAQVTLPRLADMHVATVLWRVRGQNRIELRPSESAFTVIAAARAEAIRADRVSADLQRLQAIASQGDLSEMAMARLDRELARLDLELADAQESIVAYGGYRLEEETTPSKIADVEKLIKYNSGNSYNDALVGILSKRSGINSQQMENRQRLQQRNSQNQTLDQQTLQGASQWKRAATPRAALPPAVITSHLGDGHGVPGAPSDAAASLLGVDLMAIATAKEHELILRGTGRSMSVSLAVEVPAPARWPWFSAVLALLLMALGVAAAVRRAPVAGAERTPS